MTPPERLRFFSDVPDLSGFQFPDAPPDAGQVIEEVAPTSRVQIAKTGTFKHPRYGKFTVTAQTFDAMIANFEAGHPTDELPVDFDHEPDVGGNSEACGWIKRLDQDGQRLYATVEWLWRGAFAIREKTYRYVSPTWSLAYVDEAGEKRGPTLLAFALTNRPYFQLPAVSLSATFSRDELAVCEEVVEDEVRPSDSRRRMEITPEIFSALGLDENADEQAVLTAARELKGKADTTLEAAAEAAGKVLFTKAEADKLKADAAEATVATDRIEKLEQANADQQFQGLFQQGVRDLKLAPANEEDLRVVFDAKGGDYFSEYIKRQPKLVNGELAGGRGEDDEAEAPEGVDQDSFRLDREVRAYIRDHADVDYVTALDKVRQSKVEV